MTGSALFAPFFPLWVVRLALEKSAIIVSADYRLLPSANGVADIIEDLEDFWQWTKTDLPAVMENKAAGFKIDREQILVAGGSAGGFAATSIALAHADEVAAVGMTYPLVDLKDYLYVTGPKESDPNVLRFPSEALPNKETTLSWLETTRGVESKAGMERTPFVVAAIHHQLFNSHIWDNAKLSRPEFDPFELIEAGATLPTNVWVMHGDNDTAVPLRGAQKFVDLVRSKLPKTEVRFDVVAGADHGFDADPETWSSFADEALEFVASGWLKQ